MNGVGGGLNVNWAQDFIWRCHKLQLKYNPDGWWCPAGTAHVLLPPGGEYMAWEGIKWTNAVIYSVDSRPSLIY